LLHNPRRQFSFRLRRMGRSNNTQGPFQLCDRRNSSGKPDKAKDLGLGSWALLVGPLRFKASRAKPRSAR
jgi:hypothetical protein